MNSSDKIQIFIGVVTFFAALVALFGERFWRWLERPRIQVYFNDKDTECYHQTNMNINQNGKIIASIPTYYIRLKISNFGGRTLENTEVVLEKVEPPPATFMSLNLSWAGFINAPNDIRRTVRIPQGQSRSVDVIEVMEPNQTFQFSNILASGNDPDTKRYADYSKGFRTCSIKPNTLSDIFASGRYIFHIGIYADNAKPKHIKLSVKYDGTWGQTGINGMRSKHLRVRLLQ